MRRPPISRFPTLSFHSYAPSPIGADASRCISRAAVLGRKPLSHLITDAVVNNGDDAQEIPRSPTIYRRRDIARIADADDR